MLDFLFGKQFVLTCPYCLNTIRLPKTAGASNCPECQAEIPVLYKHAFKEAPPLFLPVIGWTQVGKSVYLQALTMMTQKVGRRWPNFIASPITAATHHFLEDVRTAEKKGTMPEPTPLGQNEAYIMLMEQMERWGGRTLVLRDWAGENFKDFEIAKTQVSFLKEARTVLMMFSLPDLINAPEKSLPDLLNSYIHTLLHYGVDLKRYPRNIIVVLSKADMIDNLPVSLHNYLMNDPFFLEQGSAGEQSFDGIAMENYMELLKRESDAVKEWLEHTREGAPTLIRLALRWNMKLVFTIISSTGSIVAKNSQLHGQYHPCRALDPFFWALEFNSTPS